ncbi:MAG: hypothetical protein IT287_09965 [Bdellovibrionaceae bacterium]|nr:hypothetical protein [Pseudobdellovibrionaceae bacterium]
MIIIPFVLAVFISSSSAQMDAAPMTLEGVVVKFDEKIIVLKQKNGTEVNIPRALKPKLQGTKLGKDIVKVNVSSSDFLRLNKDLFSKPITPKAK